MNPVPECITRASKDEPWVSQFVALSGSSPSMECPNGNYHSLIATEHWTLDDSQVNVVAWMHKLKNECNTRIGLLGALSLLF